ncbi:DUF4041 domain-containing protein [Flavobacterium arcticum]|nr:DUF4041 domain-containing protein [Flavobacterium arcticum]KAF2510504.1 DUF4041 domain-containing protein [Flavobacterium arcticum]
MNIIVLTTLNMFFNRSKKLLEDKIIELSSIKDELEATKKNLYSVSNELKNSQDLLDVLKKKYSDIINLEEEIDIRKASINKADDRLKDLNENYKSAFKVYEELQNQISIYKDDIEIGSFGLYERKFNFDTSETYKLSIQENYNSQKKLVKEDKAVYCHTEWTVNGSRVEGRKQTNHYKKLMLYAFNGECDAIIAKVRWNNATKSQERILKTFESINKLGSVHNINISSEYLNCKIEELLLTHEYEEKKNEEKEEQRQIREMIREEEKAQRDFDRAKKIAEEEEAKFKKALDRARLELGIASPQDILSLNEQIASLEQQLIDAQQKRERAIAMAQLTKIGHIYVISNLGSFGNDIYKIGMTRRLNPHDRVRELGDASVPFRFDVHAIIHSENAPQLERELHLKFHDRRLNKVNLRKEFFNVSLQEIEEFIKKHTDAEIEFTKLAEAKEYRETVKMIEQLNHLSNQITTEMKFPDSLI